MGTPMRGEVERLIQESWGLDEYGSHYGQVRVAAEAKPSAKPSAKPYLSNRDRQMLALPTHKRSKVNEVLWAVEDLIGPCKSWPKWIREIYWMRKLNHNDSLKVITFGLGNSLPSHLIVEWLRVRRVEVEWAKFYTDMQFVQKIMELEEPIDKFYYDLRAKEWCFMNGLPRNAITKKVKGRKTEQGTKASLPPP
jgi:hypothetical protein